MKRTWVLVTVLLATVGGPATAAMARPISTYSLDVSVDGGAGNWNGGVQLDVDEAGFAYLWVNLSRMRWVTCGPNDTSFMVERVEYSGATFGSLAVERKLASLSFDSTQDMTWTVTGGCGTNTLLPPMTRFTSQAVATGDLQRGRNAAGRILARNSDIAISVGGVEVSGTAIVTELITKG